MRGVVLPVDVGRRRGEEDAEAGDRQHDERDPGDRPRDGARSCSASAIGSARDTGAESRRAGATAPPCRPYPDVARAAEPAPSALPRVRCVTFVTHRVELWSIRDRTPDMARSIASSLDRLERVAGMPARHAAPALLGGLALQVAVLGMYWDVGYHVDHGRDQAVLHRRRTCSSSLGLQGIVFAALLHGILSGAGGAQRAPVRALRLQLSPGGIVMLVCGGGRADRVPARRDLARAVRRGRDALGADPPAHDRRRRAEHARAVDGRAPGPRGRAPAEVARRGSTPAWPARCSSACRPSRPSSTSACRSSNCSTSPC